MNISSQGMFSAIAPFSAVSQGTLANQWVDREYNIERCTAHCLFTDCYQEQK